MAPLLAATCFASQSSRAAEDPPTKREQPRESKPDDGPPRKKGRAPDPPPAGEKAKKSDGKGRDGKGKAEQPPKKKDEPKADPSKAKKQPPKKKGEERPAKRDDAKEDEPKGEKEPPVYGPPPQVAGEPPQPPEEEERPAGEDEAPKGEAPAPDAPPNDGAVDRETDEDEEKPPIAREDEPLLRLRASVHVRLVAKSVMLRESAHRRLLAVAEGYHAATGRQLIITGGDRTPLRQAELMHRKLVQGENLLHLYLQTHLVVPLMQIYERGQEARWGRRREVLEMRAIIARQVKEGQYVSRHLAQTAVDVRSRGLHEEQVAALKAAVEAVTGARLVDERDTESPHFHLSL